MTITVLYVFPLAPSYLDYALRFVTSILEHPAGVDFDMLVVSNGGPPTGEMRALFAPFKTRWVEHDNSGFDVGGILKAAKHLDCDMVFVCGANCYVRREFWLFRIAEVWNRTGPGMYGTMASYMVRPHINTSGFACLPSSLCKYAEDHPNVRSRFERYEFEHGPDALHIQIARQGMPVRLVTWDGDYGVAHWRTPENIYQKGDQSNCLTYFWHSDEYDFADAVAKVAMTQAANGIGTTNPSIRTIAG